MPRPIFILGPGRTGKTTLARMLRHELPDYNLLHADALRFGIMRELPSKFPEELLHYEKNSHYANLLLGLVDEQLRQDQHTQGIILDGGVISPAFLAKHRITRDHQPITVFLGHGDLSSEEIFDLIRKNDQTTDWSSTLNDTDLRIKTDHFAKQNQIYRAECQKTSLRYIDTSQHRLDVLARLLKEILQNL